MQNKVRPHLKKHSKKYFALTLMLALSVVIFQFRPSQFQTTKAVANSQWDIMVNTADTDYQFNQQIVKSSAGNYYVLYEQEDGATFLLDLFLAKFDVNGTQIGNTTEIATNIRTNSAHMSTDDSSDGVYIAYIDNDPNSGAGGDNDDFFVTHIDLSQSAGNENLCVEGGLNGINIEKDNAVDYQESDPYLVNDGSNGAYVAWKSFNPNISQTRYYMTRIKSNCQKADTWVPTDTHFGDFNAFYLFGVTSDVHMLAEGTDKFLITGFGSNTIYYRKFTNTGAYITNWNSTITSSSRYYSIANDGNNGLVIAHFGSSNSNYYKITKIPEIAGSTGLTTQTYTLDGTSGVLQRIYLSRSGTDYIVTWERRSSSSSTYYFLYAQKINSAGTLLWNSGSYGLALASSNARYYNPTSPLSEHNHQIALDGAGGAFFGFGRYDATWGWRDATVHYVDTDGNLHFEPLGYTSSIATSYYASPRLVPDGAGGIILARADHASYFDDTDIYVERIRNVPPPPEVYSATPNYGPITGGNSITIDGLNFTNATNVTVDDRDCTTWGITNDTTLTCTVPDASAGGTNTRYATIKVYYAYGDSDTWGSDIYTYYGAPTITEINPPSGYEPGGALVQITGSNFGPETIVTIDGETAYFNSWSATDTTINATTPAGTGTVDVVITNPGSQTATLAGGFTYMAIPGEWDPETIIGGTLNNPEQPQSIRTSDDNFIVTWQDFRNGTEDLFIKKVNKVDGSTYTGWAPNGIQVSNSTSENEPFSDHSQVISDDAGGAYVVWAKYQVGGKSGYASAMLQHYFSDGTSWASPVDLGTIYGKVAANESSSQYYMVLDDTAVTVPGHGDIEGVYLLWYSNQVVGLDPEDTYEVVHVSANGADLYGTGIPTLLPNYNVYQGVLVPDGSGNVMAIYLDYDDTLFVNKISAVGDIEDSAGFPGTGKILSDSDLTTIYQMNAISDDAGGAIVVYGGTGVITDSMQAQKVLLSGASDWLSGGAGVTLSTINYAYADYINLTTDGSGNLYAAWQDHTTEVDIFGQYVTSAGVPQWGDQFSISDPLDESFSYFNSQFYNNNIAPGSMIVTYEVSNGFNIDNVLQKFDTAGSPLWPEGSPDKYTGYDPGVTLYHSYYPVVSGDTTGGAATFWIGMYGSDPPIDSVYGQYYGAGTDVTITDVVPGSGTTDGGTLVTITGTNFETGQEDMTVTFDGTECAIQTYTPPTQLTCLTPAHAAGAVNVIVSTTNNGSATSVGGYTYLSGAATDPTCITVAGATTVPAVNDDYDYLKDYNGKPYYGTEGGSYYIGYFVDTGFFNTYALFNYDASLGIVGPPLYYLDDPLNPGTGNNDALAGPPFEWLEFNSEANDGIGMTACAGEGGGGELKWAGNAAISADDAQKFPLIIQASDGNFISVWVDDRDAAPGSDIYAQKFDATDGSELWTPNGVIVTDTADNQPSADIWNTDGWENYAITSDEAGGVIVVYNGDDGLGITNVYAQRLNSSGAVQWPNGSPDTNGILLSNDTPLFDDSAPQVLHDGADGVYIAWQSCKDNVSCTNPSTELTRLNATTGAVHANWDPASYIDPAYIGGTYDHIEVSRDNSSPRPGFNPQLALSANNSVIVAFQNNFKRDSTSIYAQRVDAVGDFNAGWMGDNRGNPIVEHRFIAGGGGNIAGPFELTSDSTGNALIGYRNWDGSTVSARVNKIDVSNGSTLWAGSSGIPIKNSEAYAITVIADGSDGMLFSWTTLLEGNGSLYVQKINNSGTEEWTAGGIEVSSSAYSNDDSLASDGSGGAIVSWTESGETNIYAQKILSAGTLDWGTGLLLEHNAGTALYTATIAGDGTGGAVVAYDAYGTTSQDVHLQYTGDQTAGGGGCGTPGDNQQCALLNIEGNIDIFYNGYDGTMPTITYVSDDTEDDTNLSTSSFEQDAIADFVDDPVWPADSFIGVLDMTGTATAWNLVAQAPTKLCTVWNALHTDCETGANELTVGTDKMRAETTINKYDATLTIQDNLPTPTNYMLAKDTEGAEDKYDLMYWIPSTSGYVWPGPAQTVFSAPLNNADTVNLADGTGSEPYDNPITGSGETILSKTATAANVIVGTAFSSALKVPSNTVAGAYTGYITYTLSTP